MNQAVQAAGGGQGSEQSVAFIVRTDIERVQGRGAEFGFSKLGDLGSKPVAALVTDLQPATFAEHVLGDGESDRAIVNDSCNQDSLAFKLSHGC